MCVDVWFLAHHVAVLECQVSKLGVENATSFLEHRDCICKIHVYGVTSSQLDKISAAISGADSSAARSRLPT